MKKKICLLLTVVLVLTLLGACGKGDVEGSKESNQGSQTGTSQSASDASKVNWSKIEAMGLSEVAVEDYVTMGEYKGLELSYNEKGSYTKDDVESLLRSAYWTCVSEEKGGVKDRVAKDGDTVDIDFLGKLDGVAFEGGSGENYRLTLGSNSFIDGFEDGLVGVKPGETVDLELTFPDPYINNPDLAGEEVVFTVTLNFIYPAEGDELLDELIADLGSEQYTTVEELRVFCDWYLGYQVEYVYENGKKNAAMAALLEVAEVKDAPLELQKTYYDTAYSAIAQQAASNSMDIETYCMYNMFTDADTYLSTYAAEAGKQSMIIKYIADQEELNVTDKELESLIKEYAEENKVSVDDVRADNNDAYLKEFFTTEKVFEFIIENAVVKETAQE